MNAKHCQLKMILPTFLLASCSTVDTIDQKIDQIDQRLETYYVKQQERHDKLQSQVVLIKNEVSELKQCVNQ